VNKNNSGNGYIRLNVPVGYGNGIRQCERLVKDIEAMNGALVHAWKSTVKNGGTIITAGDTGLKLNKKCPATVIAYEGNYILSHAVVDLFKGSGCINIHCHIHNRESGIRRVPRYR
jgi:hypothetical protein